MGPRTQCSYHYELIDPFNGASNGCDKWCRQLYCLSPGNYSARRERAGPGAEWWGDKERHTAGSFWWWFSCISCRSAALRKGSWTSTKEQITRLTRIRNQVTTGVCLCNTARLWFGVCEIEATQHLCAHRISPVTILRNYKLLFDCPKRIQAAFKHEVGWCAVLPY